MPVYLSTVQIGERLTSPVSRPSFNSRMCVMIRSIFAFEKVIDRLAGGYFLVLAVGVAVALTGAMI